MWQPAVVTSMERPVVIHLALGMSEFSAVTWTRLHNRTSHTAYNFTLCVCVCVLCVHWPL